MINQSFLVTFVTRSVIFIVCLWLLLAFLLRGVYVPIKDYRRPTALDGRVIYQTPEGWYGYRTASWKPYEKLFSPYEQLIYPSRFEGLKTDLLLDSRFVGFQSGEFLDVSSAPGLTRSDKNPLAYMQGEGEAGVSLIRESVSSPETSAYRCYRYGPNSGYNRTNSHLRISCTFVDKYANPQYWTRVTLGTHDATYEKEVETLYQIMDSLKSSS